MLDYARQRAVEVLRGCRAAVLVTGGSAGVLAGEFPCESLGVNLYLLVPRTSDHLFNLEHDASVAVATARWAVKGHACVVSVDGPLLGLDLLRTPGAEWSVLVRVDPCQVQVRREDGWGSLETIDLPSA